MERAFSFRFRKFPLYFVKISEGSLGVEGKNDSTKTNLLVKRNQDQSRSILRCSVLYAPSFFIFIFVFLGGINIKDMENKIR